MLAEALRDAGVPKGVFNLVHGDGPTVGHAISAHEDIGIVSFTGSTRAGILVATAAAPSVKRVAQELGGKSANIVLPDADLREAAKFQVSRGFSNTANPATRRPVCSFTGINSTRCSATWRSLPRRCA